MRGKDLLEKLALVEPQYIQAANELPFKKKKKIKISSVIKAAVFLFVISGTVLYLYGRNHDWLIARQTKNYENDASYRHETYSPTVHGAETAKQNVVYGEYIYYLDVNHALPSRHAAEENYRNTIRIFSMKEQKQVNKIAEKITSIPWSGGQLLLCGEELIVIKSESPEFFDRTEPFVNTFVDIYSLSDPEHPVLEHQYVQRGVCSAVFSSDKQLYLLTSDLVEERGVFHYQPYPPSASMDGETITWDDSDICTFGNFVYYSALSVIDLTSKTVSAKKAFYGDIQDIFLDQGTIGFSVKDDAIPEVYLFDMSQGISYIGNIRVPAQGTIMDIKKYGDSYRMIGMSYDEKAEILAVSADVQKGTSISAHYPLENQEAIDDIVWDGNKAVITVGKSDNTAYFVSAHFKEDTISFSRASISVNRVTGADRLTGMTEELYYTAFPVGSRQLMIPIGSHRYLRYHIPPEWLDVDAFPDPSQNLYRFYLQSNILANGFDILDLSDEPKYVYQSKGEVPENCRFDYSHTWYENGLLYIMTASPNSSEKGRLYNAELFLYSVDPNSTIPFRLVSQYSFGNGYDDTLAGSFRIFHYDGKDFYVNPENHQLISLP